MAVKRNARAHWRNDVTLEGDNDRGGSNGIEDSLRRGCPIEKTECPGDRSRDLVGTLQRAEMTDSRQNLDGAGAQLPGIFIEEGDAQGVGSFTTGQPDVAADLVEVRERVV